MTVRTCALNRDWEITYSTTQMFRYFSYHETSLPKSGVILILLAAQFIYYTMQQMLSVEVFNRKSSSEYIRHLPVKDLRILRLSLFYSLACS